MKALTRSGNPDVARDQQLFARLGLQAEASHVPAEAGDHAHADTACGTSACGHRHAHTPPEPEVLNATA